MNKEMQDLFYELKQYLVQHSPKWNTLCDIEQYIIDLEKQLEKKDKIIDEANKILSEILVVKQGNIYRPVKNTSSQDVYKTICMLNEVLKTPYRFNYEILERGKNGS